MPLQKQYTQPPPASKGGRPSLPKRNIPPNQNQHLIPPTWVTIQNRRTAPMAAFFTRPSNPRQEDNHPANVVDEKASSGHSHDDPFADRYYDSGRFGSGQTATRFVLGPDPDQWGYDVSPKAVDSDDWLHSKEKNIDDTGSVWTWRGISTLGFIIILFGGVFYLFLGYSIQVGIKQALKWGKSDGYNLGGINATGQIMEGIFSLIDKDTPMDVRKKASPVDGRTMQLVFSDEFERPGRTFWPGDDPYWEAVDLHYWGTVDLEWYDPQQVFTKDGQLWFEFKRANNETNHGMNFVGGMLSSWNKLCFTGGYIE
ncbi:hypothetical protein FRC17_003806, partial [Serendipita sp. 399]